MSLAGPTEIDSIQLLPARRISWSGRLGLRVADREIWPTIRLKDGFRPFSFQWLDDAVWRVEYEYVDDDVEPQLWRGDEFVARQISVASSILSPVIEWVPVDGSGYHGFRVREVFHWINKTAEYLSRNGVQFASLRLRWWWQDIVMDYDRNYSKYAPLVCADLLMHLYFRTPSSS